MSRVYKKFKHKDRKIAELVVIMWRKGETRDEVEILKQKLKKEYRKATILVSWWIPREVRLYVEGPDHAVNSLGFDLVRKYEPIRFSHNLTSILRAA